VADRPLDVVLFGATGYTGGLTAEYVARHAPEGLRWALAGRSAEKLAAVRERLEAIDPACGELELLEADAADAEALRGVAERTQVVASAVGPYLELGEPLVAACAEAGTDYADITGEPEFVDRMYVLHHATAVATGARLVHACGFDSIPYDLGVLFCVQQLPEDVPLKVRGFVNAGGRPSAGTLHTAVNAMSRVRQASSAYLERRRIEPRPEGRRVSSVKEPLIYERSLGAWVLPLPTIDPQVVKRSAAALERYGPDFSYGHYAAIEQLPVALATLGGVGAMFALAQLPPTRSWLMGRMQSGEGPSPGRRERGWFRVRLIGEGGGERAVCQISGGDPGYGESAKMLAESALCLARDDLPPASGQLTPAVAMGEALTERLRGRGIKFELLESR
jgi:saccharopine dehydrogenase (NAD+, L-glutamate forming)